ncbi:helix-turn-helix domain-containing protein [Kurthia populi]|uniref:Helix-turn-helix domain-containing protein n=1 Tax=Kurthia populi TaxID=1562132 RepID=A0ABW5XX18_9BACL|nr:helix-turn-helix domain-containing protein [Candidatus Kurthia intestinigallinarum]
MKKTLPEDERKRIFGKNLEYLRNKRGIMQKDLAAELDLKPNSISNYENGKSFPSVPALLKISDYFNVSTEELLYDLNKDESMEVVKQHELFLKDVLDNMSEDELLDKYDFGDLFNELPLEQKKKVLNSIEVEYFKMNRNR